MQKRTGITALLCVTAVAIYAKVNYSDAGSPGSQQTQALPAGGAPSVFLSMIGSAIVPQAAVAVEPTYTPVGTVTKRSANQLKAAGLTSSFSIGGETTDRDYTTYSKWRSYLGPLGIPASRVQIGWGDVERVKGTYNWAKLDEIVNGMKADGVQPWLELSYGNPAYTDLETGNNGGVMASGSTLPTGPAAEAAWFAFVTEAVKRYKNRVNEWEIWNEPDNIFKPNTVAHIRSRDFKVFAFKTALAIKAEQPDAKLILGGFAALTNKDDRNNATSEPYSLEVARYFYSRRTEIPVANVEITYHAYTENPDTFYNYQLFIDTKKTIENLGIKVWMGENGAPSTLQPDSYALGNIPWTEDAQAKYDMRRMLGDFYRSIRSNIFTISDINYDNLYNTKGLLQIVDPSKNDQTIKGAKIAYNAIRNLTAVFDSRLKPLTTANCTTATPGYTIHAYSWAIAGGETRTMLAAWRSNDRPGKTETIAYIDISCTNFNFAYYKKTGTLVPRYTDLLTGIMYQPTGTTISQPNANGVTISGLRVYDSPILLSDQGIVPRTP